LPGQVRRCSLDDYSLLALIEFFYSASSIKELELQIYGNAFSSVALKGLMESIKGMNLDKLVLSVFEFKEQELDSENTEVVNLFNQLPISNKKLV
jgi:hypothetical protein